jgi:SAM-dependent methyltransferase
MSDPITAYDRHASVLADLDESPSFQDCHQDALDLVPKRSGLVLDVGAGSGRDAGWFAGRGWDVVAVEPADGMRREGQQRHPQAPIRWLSDRLPGLEAVHRLGLMFDLIWLSAIWMHVPPAERQRTFRKAGDAAQAWRPAGAHPPARALATRSTHVRDERVGDRGPRPRFRPDHASSPAATGCARPERRQLDPDLPQLPEMLPVRCPCCAA